MISKYYRDKKVLVTGGAGLIGSCITDELIECGADVVVLDNLYRGKKSYIKQVAKTNFLQCDILDTAAYREPLMDAQIVVHAASKVLGIGYSSKNHLDMMLHNDNMTNALSRQFH
jgi:GDP-D-mannose 3',5'-epimerase